LTLRFSFIKKSLLDRSELLMSLACRSFYFSWLFLFQMVEVLIFSFIFEFCYFLNFLIVALGSISRMSLIGCATRFIIGNELFIYFLWSFVL